MNPSIHCDKYEPPDPRAVGAVGPRGSAADQAVVRVGVCGALGRTGQMVVRCLLRSPASVQLAAALVSPRCPQRGDDIGLLCGGPASGVLAGAEVAAALDRCDVVIDFSSPAATAALAAAAAAAGVALVVGTTGLDEAALAALQEAAARVPVVRAANMSPGINLLLGLVRRASAALADYDAEIVEVHHRHKRDAPSGTALMLAAAIQQGRGHKAELRSGRAGLCGPRPAGELGVLAVRGGDVVGEHTVYFLGSGERVEITHRAATRDVFAAGAVQAARWVVKQKPGLYDMEDVLNLR